jgi:UDP-perosamine 4-acetyltransferase
VSRVVLLGGGGHARVVAEALRLSGTEPLGYLAPEPASVPFAPGLAHLGRDLALRDLDAGTTLLVCAIGSVAGTSARIAAWDTGRAAGFRFADARHPRALMSDGASAGPGLQLLAGAVVQTGARLGANVIVNTRAVVEHDAEVGDHSHIAPMACLSGGVRVGARAHVGAGAVVLQGRTIGEGAVVGAGSVVTRDVPAGSVVAGNPARALGKAGS